MRGNGSALVEVEAEVEVEVEVEGEALVRPDGRLAILGTGFGDRHRQKE
jgi:hypothetical protein